MERITLASPYGKFTTPDGSAIPNGTAGEAEDYRGQGKAKVKFDGRRDFLEVPPHWLKLE